jgi:predicted nucleic acid-binding Zn ribbon protein
VQKLISQTSFALKGSGWYQHGYAGGAAKPAACAASAAGGGGCSGCPKAAANE